LSCWSGTRGSLLAIVGAYATATFVFPELRRRRALQALALSALFGLLLSLIVFLPPDSRYGLQRIFLASNVGDVDVSSGRLEMWQATLRAILSRPLFGYGEGQFGLVVAESNGLNHPHNIVLQILLQWGLVGFICFSSLAALVAQRFLAAARTNPQTLPPVLVAAALLIMSLYEGSFYHPYPIMMIALATSFVLASARQGGARTGTALPFAPERARFPNAV
jgi:O-antigen ligase